MNQPNKRMWGAIVALIIAGSAGISVYKTFAESATNIITKQNAAVIAYRSRPEVQASISQAQTLAQTIEQHKESNKRAVERGSTTLYNDKIVELTKSYNNIVNGINEGERAARAQYSGLAALKNERSIVGWLSSIALSVTMPMCSWLLAFFSTRVPDKTNARIMFILSFITEAVAAVIIHDGILIMINDEFVAKLFAGTCMITLPFIYAAISVYAFNTKAKASIIHVFGTEDLPPDWRAAVIHMRRGEISPDLSYETIAQYYRNRGVKLSGAKFFKECQNGKIVPLNFSETDLNQAPRDK